MSVCKSDQTFPIKYCKIKKKLIAVNYSFPLYSFFVRNFMVKFFC